MPKSRINQQFEFSEEVWVLSILNINIGDGLQKLLGHSTLVVEGVKRSPNSINVELYIGQYDIVANTECNIDQVRVFESSNYQRDYNEFHGLSYYVAPSKIYEMIQSIQKDKEDIQKGKKIKFSKIKFSYDNKSYNCTSWCFEKMSIVGIDQNGKPKPKYAAGQCSVM